MLPDFFFYSRPRSGLVTEGDFFRVGNQYAGCEKQYWGTLLIPCKVFFPLQPMFPPKPFDCLGDLAAFRFFFKNILITRYVLQNCSILYYYIIEHGNLLVLFVLV